MSTTSPVNGSCSAATESVDLGSNYGSESALPESCPGDQKPVADIDALIQQAKFGRFKVTQEVLGYGRGGTTGLGQGITPGNTTTLSAIGDDPKSPEARRAYFVPLTLDGSDAKAALWTLGVAGVLMANDKAIQDSVREGRNETTESIAEFAEPFGTKDRLGPLLVGGYAVGVVFKDERMRQAAVQALQAAALSQLFTETVKTASQRLRPRQSQDNPYDFAGPIGGRQNTSFFSGHSSGSAAVWASVAKVYHDKPVVRNLAYLMAVVTPWSRVHDNAHWSSDAFLGAAVGFLSAEMVDRWHNKRNSNGPGILVSPGMGPDGSFFINFQFMGARPKPRLSRACRETTDQREKIRACIRDAMK